MSKKISWPLEIDALVKAYRLVETGIACRRHKSPQKPNWCSTGAPAGAPAQLELRWSSAGAPDAPKNLEKKQSQEMTIIRKNFS